MNNLNRPAWVEINLSNLDYNIKQIRNKIGPNRTIIGVIKADAYGHGASECAKVLVNNGVSIFAVATIQEAINLREDGFKEEIIVLGLTPSNLANLIVKYDITPLVCSSSNVLAINEEAKKQHKVINGIIALDTGMGRIGYLADNIDESINDIKKYNNLTNFKIRGLLSHMSTADEKDKCYSCIQREKYIKFYNALKDNNIEIPMATLANSASIMEISNALFDAVRPGIILYGYYPSNEVDKHELDIKPVMSVKAQIVHLKEVPNHTFVGYGRKYESHGTAKIATIEVGYADGYPRAYSKYAKVIVNGVVCNVAGNICMDQCMIDVTNVKDVKLGDEVILMNEEISADYIAKCTNTINYEVCCGFGMRLPKVYIK